MSVSIILSILELMSVPVQASCGVCDLWSASFESSENSSVDVGELLMRKTVVNRVSAQSFFHNLVLIRIHLDHCRIV